FQVNPKISHLHAVKKIFRYLKGQPKLGIWYHKDSPFDLVAYTNSDYAGASLDRKSTTGGYQFLGCRLISWQCKKQTVVVNSTTEAEYIAASSCCGQHIEIRHHFIKDSNEKKLIQMIKIHTDNNVADFLTKAFDLGINLLLLLKVNAARHKLTTAWESYCKGKTVTGKVKLQALVDGKKVIITETSVRRDLQLEDAEGIECLPNADIFEQLALMGFVQVFLDKQVGDMSTHDEIFVTPSHTKKVFGNMKRVGKGFSRAVTPLFPTMMVQAQEEIGEGSANPTDPHHTPIITQPSTSQPQKKQKLRNPKRKYIEIPQSSGPTEPIADETANEENVPTHSNDPLLSGEDRLKLEELMTLCTNLHNRVLDLKHTKTTQALEIESLKRWVNKLEKKQSSRTPKLKRLFKIGRSAQVVSSEDEGLGDQEDASKQGRKITDINQDTEVTLVDETQGRYDDAQMFDTDVFNGEEVIEGHDVVEKEVSIDDPIYYCW
ncbi:hypothetical protein Tco_1431382, partial [Tanacetum coccineum]